MRRRLVSLLAAVAALAAPPAAAAGYSITALPGLGAPNWWASDINGSGFVAGSAMLPPAGTFGWHAVLWRGGQPIDLGTLGGSSSNAYAVNDDGVVAGASHIHTPPGKPEVVHAFAANGPLSPADDLGTLPWADWSGARDVSNTGFVVGLSGVGNTTHAFLYDQGTMLDLGTLGGHASEANGVNERGQVAGVARIPSGYRHAFRTSGPGPISAADDLGTLGGLESGAAAVNRDGDVVGWAEVRNPGYLWHAFYWDGRMRDLGTLPGDVESAADDLNSWGQVVGWSRTATGSDRAVAWSSSGQIRDLNDAIPAGSGWYLRYASGINDRGQIVGVGSLNGAQTAFLLEDLSAPTVSCGTADGLWHNDNVEIFCTASDDESGLDGPTTFTLRTDLPWGAWDANALATGFSQVCDRAGNCTPVAPVPGNMIDMAPPEVDIVGPRETKPYLLHEVVAAWFRCSDNGAGLVSNTCVGTVPDGDAVDTQSVGTHTFTVYADDAARNRRYSHATYTVRFGDEQLSDPADATVVIRLVDASGQDVSDSSIGVAAIGTDEGPFAAPEPFTYVNGAYTYAPQSRLSPGRHELYYIAGGDPTIHSASFTVP